MKNVLSNYIKIADSGCGVSSKETSVLDMAHAAMRLRNWTDAAIRFRTHLIRYKKDAGARVLYGHCLKELGFFCLAEKEYLAAFDDFPDKAELFLQLGHLNKVAGDFEIASSYYQKAADFPSVQANIAHDARNELTRLFHARPIDPLKYGDELNIFFSCPSIADGFKATLPQVLLGKADYSYAYFCRGFIDGLERAGLSPVFVQNPEYIPHVRQISSHRGNVHLRFSPPTNPRLIKGAYNILVFAWEFEELPVDKTWPHPFADRVAVIERFDEVWVSSRFAETTLSRLSNANVRYVPSPVLARVASRLWRNGKFVRRPLDQLTLSNFKFVPLTIFPRLQHNFISFANRNARTLPDLVSAKSQAKAKIYLTIANPHDKRKQLRPLIEAFCEFARREPNVILLIKTSAFDFTTSTVNTLLMTHQLSRPQELLQPFYSENIWICNDRMNDEDLDALYAISDFYICTPVAEGQNLPLLESMLRGCIPVTPRHTAMLDYITDENAIIISSKRSTPSEEFRHTYNLKNAEIDIIDPADVKMALERTAALSPAEVADLRKKAVATVETQFDYAIIVNECQRLNTVINIEAA